MKPLVTIYSVFSFAVVAILSGCSDISSQADSQFKHSADSSYAATLSDDGAYSVVSGTNSGVSLWDITNNALKYQWSHQGSENNLVMVSAISHNNSHALTADSTNFVLWDIATGQSVGFWQVRESTIRDVAVSDNGEYLLIGKSNGVVVHITLATGRRLEFVGHQEKINSVAMSPNGRYALSGSNDYVAYLWDTESGQVRYRFNHPSRVSKVALDPQGRYAFTADSQKQAQIWDLHDGSVVSKLSYMTRQKIFSAVRFNANGTLLATGSPGQELSLWDVKTGELRQDWRVMPRPNARPASAVVHSVTFINNDQQLISESSSGFAEVWTINP